MNRRTLYSLLLIALGMLSFYCAHHFLNSELLAASIDRWGSLSPSYIFMALIFFACLLACHSVALGLGPALTERKLKASDYVWLLAVIFGLPMKFHALVEPNVHYERFELVGLVLICLGLSVRLTRVTVEVFRWNR